MRRIYEPLTSGSYYARPDALPGNCNAFAAAKLLVTSTQSAEIIKHASNAFLAMKISFINAVANLAESAEANIEEIAYGIGLDTRIGPGFLRAGLGYGGSCLPKDVAAFHFFDEVRKINDKQKNLFFDKVCTALWTLRGKRLAALGLAFKGDTDDIRESPAIAVIKMLMEHGATVTAFDPAAMERAQALLPPTKDLHYASGLYEACTDADAVLILTDWREFAEIDLPRLHDVMRFPIMIDGRNLHQPEKMIEFGFTYFSMGRLAGFPAQQISRGRVSSAACR
jgi:UDPglucose 6-dehydrogenase